MDTEEISKIKTAILKIHNGDYAHGIALLCSLVGWADKGLVDFARKGGHPRGKVEKCGVCESELIISAYYGKHCPTCEK